MSMLELYFDGACSKNPGGVASAGYVVYLGGKKMFEGGPFKICSGRGATCNVAEWAAVKLGLQWILDNWNRVSQATSLQIKGDSILVVNQLSGEWRVHKKHLKPYYSQCQKLLKKIQIKWETEWIPRVENELADSLSSFSKRGLDV